MNSFEDFWPHYVAEHSKPGTRALHLAGTTAAVTCALTLLARGKWKWLPLAIIPGYAAAWLGHFFIEGNKPATFQHPLWSFRGDFKMAGLMLSGQMENEIDDLQQATIKSEGRNAIVNAQ